MGISNGTNGGIMLFSGTALVGDSLLPKSIEGIPGISGGYSLCFGLTFMGVGGSMVMMGNGKDPIFGLNLILFGTAFIFFSVVENKLKNMLISF